MKTKPLILVLYNKLFKTESLVSNLQCKFHSYYISTGKTIQGKLIHKIVTSGYSPIEILFKEQKIKCISSRESNGIIESLNYLLFHDNYIKPWLDKYFLTAYKGILRTHNRCYAM